VAWSALMVGGMAFVKGAEHFSVAAALAPGHGTAVAAFDVFRVLASAGVALVAVAMAVALPSAAGYLRSGGWASCRRAVVVAGGLTVSTGLLTGVLATWAHHLTYHQRNGGSTGYGVTFLCWGLLLVATVAAWTWVGVDLARRLELGRAALRIEGWIAVAVAVLVAGTAIATAVWWAAMAVGASWFLAGTRPGTHPSGVTVNLVAIEGWLAAATLVALYGAARVVRTLRSA
jgi:hypothetical protein